MAEAKVTVTASFRERIALAPGAVFVATLEDVSRADAKAVVLGEARIDDAGNPPYAFAIQYDPAKILAYRAKYAALGAIAFTDVKILDGRVHEKGLHMWQPARSCASSQS